MRDYAEGARTVVLTFGVFADDAGKQEALFQQRICRGRRVDSRTACCCPHSHHVFPVPQAMPTRYLNGAT